ncbi:MAG TPA: restriction endonuclease [Chloroflexota bacterium]|nr:restriction endonuclease [Chloroflexota bacterium]
MSIPDLQTCMLPLLDLASDRQEHAFREAIEELVDGFKLTEDERKARVSSGELTINNRIRWAYFLLKRAGLLEATRRGHFRITQRGLEVLRSRPAKLTIAFLKQFPEFQEYQKLAASKAVATRRMRKARPQSPVEELEAAYRRLRHGLAIELIEAVKRCSPTFFERLVVDLLVKMGYGGTREDAGHAIGRTNDGGIDGIINEDRLGLDVIYLQAKRWNGVVGRPEIQRFAGALQGHRASKGVFITTSSFSKEARDYVSHIGSRIILIDGEQLAELLIDYNIGVLPVATYEIKRIDQNYFAES